MRTGFVLILFIIFSASAYSTNSQRLESIKVLKRFAFGSCSNQYHEQPAWKGLIQDAPDFFIWGGDNVYADTKDPNKIKFIYDLQNIQPDYVFFKSLTPIIGTWDDHDFGYDRSRGDFEFKDLSKQHLLDFLEEPKDTARRGRPGIYTSYNFGLANKKVKIILLDNRYFKDTEKDAPLLGKSQWKWLEDELDNSNARLHFIVSGITITAPWYPGGEEWKDYPLELDRLFKLLEKYQTKGVVLISGDKHFANINQRNNYLEFMSSGLTHTVPKGIRKFLTSHFGGTSFFGLNYGVVDIAWIKDVPHLKLHIKNRFGQNIFTNEYHLTENQWVRDDQEEPKAHFPL